MLATRKFDIGIRISALDTLDDRCTADSAGKSPRGSGNPAQYEQILTDIFKNIITNPKIRLVQ